MVVGWWRKKWSAHLSRKSFGGDLEWTGARRLSAISLSARSFLILPHGGDGSADDTPQHDQTRWSRQWWRGGIDGWHSIRLFASLFQYTWMSC